MSLSVVLYIIEWSQMNTARLINECMQLELQQRNKLALHQVAFDIIQRQLRHIWFTYVDHMIG